MFLRGFREQIVGVIIAKVGFRRKGQTFQVVETFNRVSVESHFLELRPVKRNAFVYTLNGVLESL